jgi:hypothetical protein
LYVGLDLVFQTVHRGKHPNDAKYTESNPNKRESATQFIIAQFLQRHFKTVPEYGQRFKHAQM